MIVHYVLSFAEIKDNSIPRLITFLLSNFGFYEITYNSLRIKVLITRTRIIVNTKENIF